MGRRRSEDCSDEGVAGPATSRNKRKQRKRLVIIAAFVLLTSLVTAGLLARIYPHAVLRFAPFRINGDAGEPEESVAVTDRPDFHLTPSDHVFREPRTNYYQWRITAGHVRPDGVRKRVYLINGQFPGPTIETRPGDGLVIEVINALDVDEAASLHWHGLSMRNNNDMDGAAWITQSPILSGESFTYNFTIDPSQHGTFWYHAHAATQRADGLYGGLVIHNPVEDRDVHSLDDENLLLIGDWYHRSAEEALQEYSHPGAFGLETVPDSILVNGVGSFHCADAVPSRPLDCVNILPNQLPRLRLNTQQRSVLRVVNVGAYTGIKLAIYGSELTPLSVDGDHPVAAEPAKSIAWIHPGERISLLAELGSVAAHYHAYLNVYLDEANFKYENPALTTIQQYPVDWVGPLKRRSLAVRTIDDQLDIQTIKSLHSQAGALPTQADSTIVLYAITQKLSSLKNEPRGFINHTTWHPQLSPRQPLIELAREHWDSHQFVPKIAYDVDKPQWIDIVLNNLDEEGHPFHLHGYDFWVLSTYTSTFDWGSYNPYEDEQPPAGPFDLVGAIKKDTVYVPRRGYAVLRLRADNPGLWQFHCHVLWHLGSGMSMAFEVVN